MIFGLWRALQSPYFASIIAKHVNERLISKVEAEVEIGNIEFSLFPPATHLNNISINKEGVVNIYQRRLSLEFSVWDFLRSEMRISEVRMNNGYIEITNPQNNNKKTKEKELTLNIFDEIKTNILDKLPIQVGTLNLKNVDVAYQNKLYPFPSFVVKPYKHSIDVDFEVGSVEHSGVSVDGGNFKFEVLKDKLRIIESNFHKNSTQVVLTGVISNSINSDLKIDYKGRVEEFIPNTIIEDYKLSGVCDCEFVVKGNLLKAPRVKSKLKLESLKSIYADLDEAKLDVAYSDKLLLLSNARVIKKNADAILKSPIKIDLNTKSVSVINIQSRGIHTHDALKFLGPDFKILNGNLYGDVDIKIDQENFYIRALEDVTVKNFHLGFSEKIMSSDEFSISNMKFAIEDDVKIEGLVNIKGKKLNYFGTLGKKGLDIEAKSREFEIGNLGGAIGKVVKGHSGMSAHFIGPYEKVILNLKANRLKNFEVLDFSVPGLVEADVSLDLNTLRLNVNRMTTVEGNKLNATGVVDFQKSDLNLGFDISNVYFAALPKSLKPIWKEISPFVEPFEGRFGGALTISGGFENLRIHSTLTSNRISFYEEPFSSFNLSFYVDNDGVFIDRINARKNKALLNLSLEYLFKSGIKSGAFKIDNLKLNDLNIYRRLGLGYDGVIQLRSDFFDDGKKADLEMSIRKSSVGRKKLRPSRLKLSLNDERISMNGSLLGGKADFNGTVFVGKRKNELSTFSSSIAVTDLKTVLGILSLHNIYDTDLRGEVLGNINAGFKVGNLDEIDLDLSLNKFRIQKLNKFLTLTESGIIKISKSNIEKISMKVRGTGGYYNLLGSGSLSKDLKLEQSFNLDFSFAQLLTSVISQSRGRVYGRGVLSGSLKDLKHYHEVNSENIAFKINKLPIAFESGEVRSVINDNVWSFERVSMNIGGGQVVAEGEAEFLFPFPKLDFDINVDSLKYPIEDKSVINLSSKLTLKGKRTPYTLGGDVVINSANIFDEFTAFQSGGGSIKGVDKYLDRAKTGLPEIITLNLNTRTADSIRIKNRLVDLLMNGSLNISGEPDGPRLKGQLVTVPTLSRFKFKGNDFVISSGNINLDGETNSRFFVLNFTSEAKVNQYDVKMDIVGDLDDIQINMESNPALSQEDIFSLLTLGLTSEFTKNLEEKDKASLTTIGIGTLLVDQLNINEGLDSTLGLKLSVLPEVSESSDSPIQASQSDQSSRVKTATKLRIQKKVTKNVDLTFSNTFGGEDGSKQEMNIDFNINDRLSIQGVFEKENDSEDDGEDSSVGADIKYKWSF